jgi:adenylosuccinate lyase
MIERYSREIMNDLWSEERKYQALLKVEIANCYAWHKQGLFDEETFNKIKKATVDIKRAKEIEKETKHDIVAFVKAASESLGEEKKYFHYGLTSTDVVDSAYSLRLKDVNDQLLNDIDAFMDVLKNKALQYKKTPIMGRTHGMHAEIMSFGMKFALWYEDFKRLRHKFILASKEIEVLKLSGAVGTYSTSNPKIQVDAAKYLDLKASKIASQTLQRDRHAFYISIIALIGAEIEKIATEIRHLSRTELREVSEAFSKNQKGSSAMPHKKNPILSENVCGLARILKGYLHAAYENIALWHERDISHSSTERIMLPDATTLLDFILHRYTNTLDQLVVFEERMISNIESSHGFYATQKIMNTFVDKGYDRLSLHDHIQGLVRQAEEKNCHLKEVILNDEWLGKEINQEEVKEMFSYKHALKYIDDIYLNVFN